MKDSHHQEWTDRLSDYLDGALDGGERAALEEHLRGCPPCARVLSELRAVVERAGALGPLRPPRELWPAIAAALDERPGRDGEDVVPLRVGPRDASGEPRRGWWLSRGQLATAATLLIAASAALTWAASTRLAAPAVSGESPAVVADPFMQVSDEPTPPPGIAAELSNLESALQSARGRLDPNTLRILDKNLRVIEDAIDDSYRALELDPHNEFLSTHLQRVYERKLDYLREAAEIVSWAG